MDMTITTALLGGLVGAILGLTGAGGSIIAVPLLIFGLHLSTAQAVPIALLAVAISAITGAAIGLKHHEVRYRAASLIAITGILMAPLGVWAASKVPNQPLTLIFALVLSYVAVRMLVQKPTPLRNTDPLMCDLLPCQVQADEGRIHWNMKCARALSYTGMLTGFLSGMLGVGGGFVVVPALKKYSNITMSQILPTSLSVIALIASTGVITAVILGKMQWPIAIPFALGALLGMLISRQIARHFSSQALQRSFATFALFVAISLIYKAFALSL
jgi:uncharacterized protein